MQILWNNLLGYVGEVYKIHKEKLGDSYLDKNYFIEQAKKNRLIIAKDDSQVLGYLIFDLATEKEFFESKHISDFGSDNLVLCLLTMAVKHERNGIGTMMTKYCIDKYNQVVKDMYSPVWKSAQGANAHKLLTNCGFKVVKEIENYWYEDSLGKAGYCPVCGTPCKCTMAIYKKGSSVEK